MCGRFHFEKEIFPSQLFTVITQGKKTVEMKWGFPKWDSKGIIINARFETIQTNHLFNEHFRKRRVVIPMEAYYEWKDKKRYRITHSDKSMMYVCGIEDGNGNFLIITTESNKSVSDIHNRMPLMIKEDKIDAYLANKPFAKKKK